MFGCIFDAIEIQMIHISTAELSEPGQSVLQKQLSRTLCSSPHFRWQTCLRQVIVAPTEQVEELRGLLTESKLRESGGPLSSSDLTKIEILSGSIAYRRLLELISGLHSPVVGETEVLGQFKEANLSFQRQVLEGNWRDGKADPVVFSAFDQVWRNWASALMEDVKAVRSRHLQDLGSQSYGSVVRRELKTLNGREVSVLGSGRLALDILPFVAAKFDVTVYCRDLVRASQRLAPVLTGKARVQVRPISPSTGATLSTGATPSRSQGRALIIAAPMTALEILSWWRTQGSPIFSKILDLRAEGRKDVLPVEMISPAGQIRNLDQVFSEIELASSRVKLRKESALSEVVNLVGDRAALAYHRPFGWDDV